MDLDRYSRQLSIPQLGEKGQNQLQNSAVLVIGTGGLGSTLLYCLAGAGVGRIGFMDGDVVALSNLNRQFLHTEQDIERQKVKSATEKLKAFNSTLIYEPIFDEINAQNVEKYLENYDVIALAVDQLEPRFVVNDACCKLRKPLVNGGVDGMNGMVNLIVPGQTPCLRCLYGEPSGSGKRPSSFAPVVSTISAMEAQLVLLVLLGKPPLPFEKMLFFDGLHVSWDSIRAHRDFNCPACSDL